MADYELIGLNEATPDLRAPTSADTGVVEGGLRIEGFTELDGGADINGDPLATVSSANPLQLAPRVAMTAAASGSSGWLVQDNVQNVFGTLPWTVVQKAGGRTFEAFGTLYRVIVGPSSTVVPRVGFELSGSTVTPQVRVGISNYNSDTTLSLTDFTSEVSEWAFVYTPESASSAGSVLFYRNGLLFGSYTIAAGTPQDFTGGNINLSGSPTQRDRADVLSAILYNRALSATEVLSLFKYGVDPADVRASQTALTSGTLIIGQRYAIDTFVTGDDFTNVGAASNASGVTFVATGTTPTTWANSSSLRATGATLSLSAQDAQSNTGQVFDRSGNGNHALLPASGATVLPRKLSGEVRWTNTWSGTHELQYIGGTNQAILPANAYIESIVGTVSGATPHDIIIGDGSDADRYVTITTGLAAGTTTFTLANRTTDGTNLKLTVDPDTNATMIIVWTIKYTYLEQ